MPFQFEETKIKGAIVVKPRVIGDDRGFFMEAYKQSEFSSAGIAAKFVQENHSRSRRGVLRGLHFQRHPRAQAKLVRVVSGEVLDIAVDLLEGSPTCGQWIGVPLSTENRHMLYIPPWCAHGFCVISDTAEIVYQMSEEYSPEHESGIAWNDPSVRIQWPITDPVLSERDRNWRGFEPMDGSVFNL